MVLPKQAPRVPPPRPGRAALVARGAAQDALHRRLHAQGPPAADAVPAHADERAGEAQGAGSTTSRTSWPTSRRSRRPRWPFAAPDPALVARGKAVFERSCSTCHGTYGETRTYPERAIPLADVGTDRMRLRRHPPRAAPALRRLLVHGLRSRRASRSRRAATWPRRSTASGPARPTCTTGACPRSGTCSTPRRVPRPGAARLRPPTTSRAGACQVLEEARGRAARAWTPGRGAAWFDTSRPGKSAGGHLFPLALTPAQREAVLAYLLTLLAAHSAQGARQPKSILASVGPSAAEDRPWTEACVRCAGLRWRWLARGSSGAASRAVRPRVSRWGRRPRPATGRAPSPAARRRCRTTRARSRARWTPRCGSRCAGIPPRARASRSARRTPSTTRRSRSRTCRR